MAETPRFRFTPRTRKNMDEVFMALGERAHTLTVEELAAFSAQFITSDGTVAQVADLAEAAATTYQALAEKGQPDGYAELDGSGDVPDGQIPSGITRDSELTAAIADFIARTIVDAAGDLIVGSGVDTVVRLAQGANGTFLGVSGGTLGYYTPTGAADEQAKVSSADTTSDYLEDKIVAGANVTITKLNTGANEQLSIASSGGGGSVTSYSTTIGDGVTTSIVVTHSLGTRDVVVMVRLDGSPYTMVECGIAMTSTSTITLEFDVAPASNELRVTVHA